MEHHGQPKPENAAKRVLALPREKTGAGVHHPLTLIEIAAEKRPDGHASAAESPGNGAEDGQSRPPRRNAMKNRRRTEAGHRTRSGRKPDRPSYNAGRWPEPSKTKVKSPWQKTGHGKAEPRKALPTGKTGLWIARRPATRSRLAGDLPTGHPVEMLNNEGTSKEKPRQSQGRQA